MKAEAMSPRKRRRVHDVVEIMAPLKHDCLFPLTTPTCQWVGHAAPETDYDFSFACVFMCVCVCVCLCTSVLGRHRGRNATPGHTNAFTTIGMRYRYRFARNQRLENENLVGLGEIHGFRFRKLEMD